MSPDAAPSPLRALTAGLARGDDEAWARFHLDYGPAIFRQLLAATHGNHDLASEALQQAYLRVARHARPCDEALMFSAWLRTVARSALYDCLRRRKSFWELLRRKETELNGYEREPGPDHEDVLAPALEFALGRLSESDRLLLERKYFTGTDVRTLAAQLDVTPKTVESRLTRARAEVRRLMLSHLKRHD